MPGTATSSSSGSSRASQLEDDTMKKLAHDVISVLMSKTESKIPVKRSEVVKISLGEYPRSYDVVMERVQHEIRFFGVRMVKVDQPIKSVMLVNVNDNMSQFKTRRPGEKAEEVLRLLVLSFIFMRNNCVRDDVLWDYLQKLGIIKDDTHFVHNYFGDARKIVSKVFVKQMYLDCCKVPNSDPPYCEYSFGKRAHVETSKRDLLEFVCKMYGTDDLNMFRAHLDLVVKEEEDWKSNVGRDNQKFTVPASGQTLSQSEEPGPSRKSSASQPGLSLSARKSSASQPSTSRMDWTSQPGPSSSRTDSAAESRMVKRFCGSSSQVNSESRPARRDAPPRC